MFGNVQDIEEQSWVGAYIGQHRPRDREFKVLKRSEGDVAELRAAVQRLESTQKDGTDPPAQNSSPSEK